MRFTHICKNSNANIIYLIANYKLRNSSMYKIHWYSFKKFLFTGSVKSRLLRLGVLLLWPMLAIFFSIYYVKKFGKIIASTYSIQRKSLFLESLSLALFENVTPINYYRYQLYLHENKTNIKYMIFGNEAKVLLQSLNNSIKLDCVDNKCEFYRICKKNGMKIPNIYGIIHDKKSFIELPKEDVIIKPSRGSKALGIELWLYNKNNNKYSSQDKELEAQELYKYIMEKYENLKTKLIVQQRIKNHIELESLSNGALVTVRVVTMRNIKNEILHLMSVLVIPVGEKMLQHKVILSPIDEKTGKLGTATTYGVTLKKFEYHPDKKTNITGFRVPYWEEIINIAKEAHKYFLDYMSLGWDIAITDDGPIIIEANKIWDVETIQKPHGRALGNTIFADICCEVISKNKVYSKK